MPDKENPENKEVSTKKSEPMLYDSNPSMFRNRPFLFILAAALVIVGVLGAIYGWWNSSSESERVRITFAIFAFMIGASILFFWWLEVVNTRLTVTDERIRCSTGILSKNIHEVFLSDIRSVQINQRFLQRLFITGHLEVSSAASSEAEIKVDGIPSPYKVKEIIDKHRREHAL
jgi:uncharacterized membrane protein YdbT with pleckstrin-like domain